MFNHQNLPPMDYYAPLLADKIYHIVGRAVGTEKLFLNDDNYHFFLKRYKKYIAPVADTFAWSLLPNHFHFLIQVKPYPQLQEFYKTIKPHKAPAAGWQPGLIMQQFSNMLNSYAKAFNKKNNRKGALFMDYLRRVEVLSDAQYSTTVFYIHKNAVHHGYCKTISGWPWSSYNSLLSNAPTNLMRQQVLNWFGGPEKFIAFHAQPIHLKNAVVVEIKG